MRRSCQTSMSPCRLSVARCFSNWSRWSSSSCEYERKTLAMRIHIRLPRPVRHGRLSPNTRLGNELFHNAILRPHLPGGSALILDDKRVKLGGTVFNQRWERSQLSMAPVCWCGRNALGYAKYTSTDTSPQDYGGSRNYPTHKERPCRWWRSSMSASSTTSSTLSPPHCSLKTTP